MGRMDRRLSRRAGLWLAVLLAPAGCYQPHFQDGQPCSPTRACPLGQTCGDDGLCTADGAGGRDGGPTADGGSPPDADVSSVLIDFEDRVTDTSATSYHPVLAWADGTYGVVWLESGADGDAVYFTRVDGAGTKLGDDVQVSGPGAKAFVPTLAWSGDGYGVAWADQRDGDYDIYFRALDADGTPMGDEVPITNTTTTAYSPSLVWTGTQFAMAWQDDRDAANGEIYWGGLGVDGRTVDEVRVTNDGSASAGAKLVTTADGFGLLWMDTRGGGNYGAYIVTLDAAGNPGTPHRLSAAGSTSLDDSLAWTGKQFVAAWDDIRDPVRTIYFARADAAGVPVGSEVKEVAPVDDALFPAVVTDGSQIAIAWRQDGGGLSDLTLGRRSSNGDEAGSPIPITRGEHMFSPPSLVSAGKGILAVAWEDGHDGNYEIYLRELEPPGECDSSSSCAGGKECVAFECTP